MLELWLGGVARQLMNSFQAKVTRQERQRRNGTYLNTPCRDNFATAASRHSVPKEDVAESVDYLH
jgi:hypothetical protein